MTFTKYANQVVYYIPTNSKMKKRIKEDIINQLEEMDLRENRDDLIEAMGKPEDVANEFIENLDIKQTPLGMLSSRNSYEYKSERTIMGMPLIHMTSDHKIAKGFIAVGGVSLGVFSFGGVSFGIFSFGGLSIGLLFAFGGVSISLGTAIGGLAIGYLLSLGGAAVSKVLAIGGSAYAKDIAIGDNTSAQVCGYITSFKGDIGINIVSDKASLLPTVKEHFPNLMGIYYSIIDLASNIRHK